MSFLSSILSKIKPGAQDNAPTSDIKEAQSELQKAMGPLQEAIEAQKMQKIENERLVAERREQYAAAEAVRQSELAAKAADLTAQVDQTQGQLTLGDEIRSAGLEEIQSQLDMTESQPDADPAASEPPEAHPAS